MLNDLFGRVRWYFCEQGMVGNIVDDAVIKNRSSESHNQVFDMPLGISSFCIRASEPQLHFKSNWAVCIMFQVFLPSIKDACFGNSVLNAPPTNVFKAKENISEFGETSLKFHMPVGLVSTPKRKHIIKCLLIGHDQIEATVKQFISVLLVIKVFVGINLIGFNLPHPFETLYPFHSIGKVFHVADGFYNQHLLGVGSCSGLLNLCSALVERSLESRKDRRKPLSLPVVCGPMHVARETTSS